MQKGMVVKSGCFMLVAGFLLAGTAMATSQYVNSPFDPSGTDLKQAALGIQSTVQLIQRNAVQHAGENKMFRMPSVFAEYDYADSHDRRNGGFDSKGDNGTVGLSFLTAGDVAMSLMVNYGNADAENSAGVDSDTENYGLTLTASKSINWFLFGMSASYGEADSRIATTTESYSYTLAPFIGAVYTSGNLALSTVPTYMFRRQDDGATMKDDGTFVWMNSASYAVSEALTFGLSVNWTHVAHTERPVGSADRDWLSIGPKVTYNVSQALSVYASYTKAVFSSTYDSQDFILGMNYNF